MKAGSLRTWLVIGGVALAVAIGRWSAATPAPAAPAPTTAAPAPAIERAVSRAENPVATPDRAPARPASGWAPADEEDEPDPPTVAQDDAASRALELVDQALRRATWTEDDQAALERLLPDMAQAQRMDVLRELAASINDGALALDTPG